MAGRRAVGGKSAVAVVGTLAPPPSVFAEPKPVIETVSLDTLVAELAAAATTPALLAVVSKATEYIAGQEAAMKKSCMVVWVALRRGRKGAVGDSVWNHSVASAFGATLHAGKE